MAMYGCKNAGSSSGQYIEEQVVQSLTAGGKGNLMIRIKNKNQKRFKIGNATLSNASYDTSVWFNNTIHIEGGSAGGTVLINNITYPCDIDLSSAWQTCEQAGGANLRFGISIITSAVGGSVTLKDIAIE